MRTPQKGYEERKAKIIKLRKIGLTISEISERTGYTKSMIEANLTKLGLADARRPKR